MTVQNMPASTGVYRETHEADGSQWARVWYVTEGALDISREVYEAYEYLPPYEVLQSREEYEASQAAPKNKDGFD